MRTAWHLHNKHHLILHRTLSKIVSSRKPITHQQASKPHDASTVKIPFMHTPLCPRHRPATREICILSATQNCLSLVRCCTCPASIVVTSYPVRVPSVWRWVWTWAFWLCCCCCCCFPFHAALFPSVSVTQSAWVLSQNVTRYSIRDQIN